MPRKLRVLLFIILIFNISNIYPQENQQSPPKFPIGAFLTGSPNQAVFDRYDSTGFNWAAWGAYSSTNSFLSNYNVLAMNAGWNTDWISYYTTSYYSRWEGEQNEPYSLPMHIGVKHKYGKDTIWHDTTCWSSLGVTAPACSLMFGPHYRQDQRHKSWYHTGNIKGVDYYSRFNLALDNPDSLSSNKNICVIKVVYRYAEVFTSGNWLLHDSTFLADTLKILDFPQDGSFKIFDFNRQTYRYPDTFYSAIVGDRPSMAPAFPENISPSDTTKLYSHDDDDNGIQFWVDYLGDDSTSLFIDYAEVYDSAGWDHYINPLTHQGVIDSIQAYVQRYSDWNNIQYWYGQDEPYSLDSFTPIHIVDSLSQHFGGAPVTQYVQPGMVVNGDTFMVDYYNIAKPEKIIIDPYPFSPDWYPVRWEDLKYMGDVFQVSSSLQSGFWFVGQGFGEKIDNNWYVWRLPDSTELKASIMQSLAYGVKGLLFWTFNSHSSYDPIINANVYTLGIVNEDGSATELWYLIHNNFVPRLEGKLGDRLLGLSYTGNFITARYFIPSDNSNPQTVDYLTLPCYSSSSTMNWHAGFFNRNGYSDDKYFFAVNLLPNDSNDVCVSLTPPVSGFTNYRFRNYEGYFDTTFTGSQFTYTLSHPAGEGYLYEVAPVVKYGGKLYANDTISTNLSLYDDLTIENGKTLTVNAIYDCYANIYTKGSGKIQTVNGGTINFYNGKGIIAQGTPYIIGTSSNKLTIDFGSTSLGTGIQLLQGTNAHINYCILKNSVNLITASSSQLSTLIYRCDFQNTSSYAVSLAGTSTHTPSITYCTFTNTDNGVFAAGQSSFTINENTFTNNKLAISLSQIASVQIIHNYISSDLETSPGIFLSSCGGNIRRNTITGHSYGISLANSSPLIGDNYIYNNKINGIYVGTGSVPDLRGALVGLPNNRYPISGYNDIEDNGGYSLPTGLMTARRSILRNLIFR